MAKDKEITIDHFINLTTRVCLPRYSQQYHNIDGKWVSVDDIDPKNISLLVVDIDKIRMFNPPSENDNYRDFQGDYCEVVLWSGEKYPIHGKYELYQKYEEEWKTINWNIFCELNEKLREIKKTYESGEKDNNS